jgi:hypothetical protein
MVEAYTVNITQKIISPYPSPSLNAPHVTLVALLFLSALGQENEDFTRIYLSLRLSDSSQATRFFFCHIINFAGRDRQ